MASLRRDDREGGGIVVHRLAQPGGLVLPLYDRNRDGVVSRGEFVGPPVVFRELDADGVISAVEAAHASGR